MFIPFSASLPPMRIMSVLPSAGATHVQAFCESVSPGERPILLPVRAEAESEPGECFYNARRRVESEGGCIRFGWALWEWPRVFIEAEHHAVHESTDGSLTDVTPSTDDDPQVARLFLPDDKAIFDFEHAAARRDNIRRPLTADAQIEEYLAIGTDLISATILNTPVKGRMTASGADATHIQSLARRSNQLKREIAMRYTPQGAPCFCGSGQKFKRCHGQKNDLVRKQ